MVSIDFAMGPSMTLLNDPESTKRSLGRGHSCIGQSAGSSTKLSETASGSTVRLDWIRPLPVISIQDL